MKSVVAAVALLASSAVASSFNPPPRAGGVNHNVSPVHARLNVAHSKMRRANAGKVYKRCKPKTSSSAAPAATPAPTSAAAPAPAYTSSSSAAAPAPSADPAPSSGGGDVINVKTSGCGDIGASAKTTKTAGANGSEEWLNCGIENGGWTPPFIQVSDLKYKNLSDEMNNGNSIFKPCKQYLDIINDAAGAYDLPPIMIASIMMQESTCNKDTVGGGGEQGLMQITKDKCGSAPNGDCRDPWYNIHTGSKYLADQIKASGGNCLLAVGSYNGWYDGLTYAKATAAKNSACCTCQNNLDYPHQFFNGWMQGIDAYSTDLGTYKNLNSCGN